MIKRANLPTTQAPEYFRLMWGKKTFTSMKRLMFRYFNEETQSIPEFLIKFYVDKSVWYRVSDQAKENVSDMVQDFMSCFGEVSLVEADLTYYQMRLYWDVKPNTTVSFTWSGPKPKKQWYKKWYRGIKRKTFKIKLYSYEKEGKTKQDKVNLETSKDQVAGKRGSCRQDKANRRKLQNKN